MAEKKETAKKEEKKEETKNITPEEQGRKSKTKIILGLSAVFLSALGGGGFFAYKTFLAKPQELSAHKVEAETTQEEHKESSSNSKDASNSAQPTATTTVTPTKEEEKKDTKDSETKSSTDDKSAATQTATNLKSSQISFFPIERMEVNLGNPIESRYLRIALSLSYLGGKDQQEELTAKKDIIKDIIITTANNKTRMDLLTSEGKETFRKDLLNQINQILERPIQAVFFTDFFVE